MGKRIERGTPITHAAPVKPTRKQTGLDGLKAKTIGYMDRKGSGLLGAGKPPNISDRAPSKYAKRVPEAVSDVLPQRKKQRAK